MNNFLIFSICSVISLGAWAVAVESVTAHHPGTDPTDSKPWMNSSLTPQSRAELLVHEMTMRQFRSAGQYAAVLP